MRATLPHLRLEADPALMSSDERDRAASALREALELLTATGGSSR